MSIQAVGWALDQDLPARPKLVLVSIANHANSTDGYCWLNAETIAAEASCSPRGVFNFVGDLIRNGFIKKAHRRGADGKQRSTDYWILFNREPAEWMGRTEKDEEIGDSQALDAADETDAESQDIVDGRQGVPTANTVENSEEIASENAPLADGPVAPACHHKQSAEPSKIKSEDARARAPRHYRPPPPAPPSPVGAVAGENAELIFVFYPSKAYDAWARVRERERKARGDYRPFRNTTWREGRQGWYFPKLFPDEEKPPSSGDPLADESNAQLAKTG